uniref:SHSP domain-containing protein n=1 Tax=Callorhinchus milii TaxID=7868 RepID=A0A4W3J5C8_CALMI
VRLHYFSESFSVTLNVGDVNVEEITVKVKDRKLSVSGQHVEIKANGFSFQCFTSEFILPPDLDATALTATISDDHFLKIEGFGTAHISSSSQTEEGSEPQVQTTKKSNRIKLHVKQ